MLMLLYLVSTETFAAASGGGALDPSIHLVVVSDRLRTIMIGKIILSWDKE